MKKKKFLCIEFHNVRGEVVPELCKCPAQQNDLIAAASFLKDGCDFVVSLQECQLLDDGTFITPFETIKNDEDEK